MFGLNKFPIISLTCIKRARVKGLTIKKSTPVKIKYDISFAN